MADEPEGWRVVVIAVVLPVAQPVIEAIRAMGHDVVGWVLARRPHTRDQPPPPWGEPSDKSAPRGLNLIMARDKADLAGLLRGLEADVALCFGFPWKIPQEALDVPRYGIVNQHPAPLPRYRGPIPMSWALREGDDEFFITWHRMDADLDTGPILAQTTVPILDEDNSVWEMGPKMIEATVSLIPEVFEKLAAGDPGEPQATEGATWAGFFDEDYAKIDWSRPRREIHNQVRAWHLAFDSGPVRGPIGQVDGKRVKVNRTSLTDPGDGSQAVDAADGKIWILESEPA
ncbi:MAG: methionyl-tRNA formyltransferase [Actinobacteria bacterium]|nr:MAG: methionyl-tRNA formyltransferase [Actinomycetota bacterium]